MTTKFKRNVLWGALLVFALLIGSVLGRFVVGGLADGGKMLAGDNAAANFWEQQDKARNASALTPANVASARGGGAHVCQGCDASSSRLRQPGNQAFHYDPQAADGAGDASPTPPATPPHQ